MRTNYLTGKIKYKYIQCIFFLITSVFFLLFLLSSGWDHDSFFLIPTGDYILQNGIPYTNPFSIDTNLSFTAQQWLYCVIYALFNRIEIYGSVIFTALNFLALFCASFIFVSKYKWSVLTKCLTVSLTILICMQNFISPRPEMLTVTLLLIECIALEKYKKTKSPAWLILLPLSAVAESNFHASMIWIHFAIWLAYFVPSLKPSFYTDDSLFQNKKEMTAAAVSMLVASCINPYGIEAPLYLIKSISADTFSVIKIEEMSELSILSIHFLLLAVLWILLFCNKKIQKINSVQFYLIAGFSLGAVMAIRNLIFLYIAALYLVCPIVDYITGRGINYNTMFNTLEACASLAILVCLIIFSIFEIKNIYQNAEEDPNKWVLDAVGEDTALEDFVQYIDDKGSPVFAGFSRGSYMEFRGFTNVFMDARPELYTSALNQKADILKDYAVYFHGNGYSDTSDESLREGIIRILQTYDFDYLIVGKYQETPLYLYLDSLKDASGYREVMQSDSYVLYERSSLYG